jgi:hypothetical protein
MLKISNNIRENSAKIVEETPKFSFFRYELLQTTKKKKVTEVALKTLKGMELFSEYKTKPLEEFQELCGSKISSTFETDIKEAQSLFENLDKKTKIAVIKQYIQNNMLEIAENLCLYSLAEKNQKLNQYVLTTKLKDFYLHAVNFLFQIKDKYKSLKLGVKEKALTTIMNDLNLRYRGNL